MRRRDRRVLWGGGAERFVRFVAVGGAATGIQYAVLIALVRLFGVDPVWSSTSGFAASSIANYLLNRRFTFGYTGAHRQAVVRFGIVAGIGLVVNGVLMAAAIGAGLHYVVGQIATTAAVLVWNFAGNSLWTFRGSIGGLALLGGMSLFSVGRVEASPPNEFTVTDMSGLGQENRVVSVARPFRPGEIRGFVRASVGGVAVATQNDVKNRWSDGSVKFAIISFVIPRLSPHSSVTVGLTEAPEAPAGEGLTQEAMLSERFDFEASIELKNGVTRVLSARRMLAAGHWRYWLRGPIVTAVVIEDRSPARTYDTDFGDGSRALHPIFEAWFYPGADVVEAGYTVENTWASSVASRGMRDVSYEMVLRSGRVAGEVRAMHPGFVHIGRSRWHQRFWMPREPGPVRIDHNTGYLVTTRAIPNYDTGVQISERLIAQTYEKWLEAPRDLAGSTAGIGNYEKGLSAAGANDWIGLLPTWDTMYLLTMDERMRRVAIGNADLAGRIPWHFREADTRAGTGRYFDRPRNGSVDTQGRVVSINARRTVSLWDLGPRSDCGSSYTGDRINTGPVSDDGWITTRDHMPDTAYLAYLLTGRYYYLEELQYLAAFIVAHRTGCYSDTEPWHRQGHNGYLHDSQLRGDAWGFRTLAYAAFLSPDRTPEKAYFEDKLGNNIAAWEGEHDVPPSDASRIGQWRWANDHVRDARGPSPLGVWRDLGPAGVQPPLFTDGRLESAGAGWEEHFLLVALGMARGFGFQTDGLLRFMARLRLNLLLNPTANPYVMDTYRWPHKLAATDDWVQTYADFARQYVQPPAAWAREGTADHGYGFIALAATSYLTPYTVDGYSGEAAWARYKGEKPGQERFRTESPKWAIVPLPPDSHVTPTEGSHRVPRRP